MEIFAPQILIPKFIANERDPMNVNVGLSGEYEVIKKTKGVVTQHLKFKNVITDKGLRYLAGESGSTYNLFNVMRYLYLGTGTTEPTSTDQTLQAWSSAGNVPTYSQYQNLPSYGSTISDYYCQIQWDYSLSQGIGNWTELGVSWVGSATSSPYVFSRSLFRDAGGNPITVQKTSDDTLTVIYKIHCKRASDTPFSDIINLSGVGNIQVDSIVTNRGLSDMASMSYSLFATNSYFYLGTGTPNIVDPTRSALRNQINTATSNLITVSSYVAGTYYRDYTVEWPASITGNITEASLHLMNSTYLGILAGFTPTIPKDNTKKLRLGYRVTLGRVA